MGIWGKENLIFCAYRLAFVFAFSFSLLVPYTIAFCLCPRGLVLVFTHLSLVDVHVFGGCLNIVF